MGFLDEEPTGTNNGTAQPPVPKRLEHEPARGVGGILARVAHEARVVVGFSDADLRPRHGCTCPPRASGREKAAGRPAAWKSRRRAHCCTVRS